MTTIVSGWFASYSVAERFERFVIQNDEALAEFVSDTGANINDGFVVEIYYSDKGSTQEEFLNAVNQTLILVVLATGLITFMLIITITHPGLRMIEEITTAATKMASGDLKQRVEIRSGDEIGELALSFNNMADSLQQNEKLRSTMVSDIAHELRTPLSNIQGYMEGLRDGIIPPNPKLFQSLYEESTLLTRLVNDLQTLTLAEAKQLHLVMQPVPMEQIIPRTVSSLETSHSEHAGIIVQIQEKLPLIKGDPDRISQILRNLLENALKHTPSQGTITITAYAESHYVITEVHDTGYGIKAEHLPYVFERFYRTDQSRTRSTGGSGIGLAIVKQLVEAHKGTISVKSTFGKGSTFTFRLPIYEDL